MSETEIIQKLQLGSEQAFRQLVEKYQKLLVNTCYRLVYNTEDAEDIAKVVFVEVFRSLKLSGYIVKFRIHISGTKLVRG